MAKAKEITLQFSEERETAKTVRFEEAGEPDDHKVGKLYVKKTTLKTLGNPKKLTVTVTPG